VNAETMFTQALTKIALLMAAAVLAAGAFAALTLTLRASVDRMQGRSASSVPRITGAAPEPVAPGQIALEAPPR
jgi:hypothetical protein